MKIDCVNVNGLRAREHQLRAIKEPLEPDVLSLQETKFQDADFLLEMLEGLGIHASHCGQKGHCNDFWQCSGCRRVYWKGGITHAFRSWWRV